MTFPLRAFDESNKSIRVGKQSHNHEIGVYQATNIFSYQSTWGTSVLRDVTSTSGSGSIGRANGAIRLETGTTTGSEVEIATRRNGEYQPGKTTEAGIGAALITSPTGDGWVRIGIFDDDDGFFYQIEANNVLKCVTRRNGVDTQITQQNFNADTLDGDNDADNPSGRSFSDLSAYIYTLRFSYYGVGPCVFLLHSPTTRAEFEGRFSSPEMKDLILHREVLENFPSIQDPNQKVRIVANNGTTTTNIQVDVGGRRYDVLGEFDSELRPTGDFRFATSVSATGVTPLVAMRKKSEFPSGEGRNTVNSYTWGFEVYSDTDVVFWVFTGGTINGTWDVPTNRTDAETSLQSNTNATTYTGGEPLLGPFIAKASTGFFNSRPGESFSKKLRIPLTGTEPVVIAATSSSGTASVDATIIVNEDW